jgi:hypothetical protein
MNRDSDRFRKKRGFGALVFVVMIASIASISMLIMWLSANQAFYSADLLDRSHQLDAVKRSADDWFKAYSATTIYEGSYDFQNFDFVSAMNIAFLGNAVFSQVDQGYSQLNQGYLTNATQAEMNTYDMTHPLGNIGHRVTEHSVLYETTINNINTSWESIYRFRTFPTAGVGLISLRPITELEIPIVADISLVSAGLDDNATNVALSSKLLLSPTPVSVGGGALEVINPSVVAGVGGSLGDLFIESLVVELGGQSYRSGTIYSFDGTDLYLLEQGTNPLNVSDYPDAITISEVYGGISRVIIDSTKLTSDMTEFFINCTDAGAKQQGIVLIGDQGDSSVAENSIGTNGHVIVVGGNQVGRIVATSYGMEYMADEVGIPPSSSETWAGQFVVCSEQPRGVTYELTSDGVLSGLSEWEGESGVGILSTGGTLTKIDNKPAFKKFNQTEGGCNRIEISLRVNNCDGAIWGFAGGGDSSGLERFSVYAKVNGGNIEIYEREDDTEANDNRLAVQSMSSGSGETIRLVLYRGSGIGSIETGSGKSYFTMSVPAGSNHLGISLEDNAGGSLSNLQVIAGGGSIVSKKSVILTIDGGIIFDRDLYGNITQLITRSNATNALLTLSKKFTTL